MNRITVHLNNFLKTWAWTQLHSSLTSLVVCEDQRMSSATRHLKDSGLLRLHQREGHRGGFQHILVTVNCTGMVSLLKDEKRRQSDINVPSL